MTFLFPHIQSFQCLLSLSSLLFPCFQSTLLWQKVLLNIFEDELSPTCSTQVSSAILTLPHRQVLLLVLLLLIVQPTSESWASVDDCKSPVYWHIGSSPSSMSHCSLYSSWGPVQLAGDINPLASHRPPPHLYLQQSTVWIAA